MIEQTELQAMLTDAKQCLRSGDVERAIELLRQVIGADADRADAHEALAAAYFRRCQYEQAIEHFQAVSRLNPRQMRTDINIGAIYNRMGRFQDAVAALRRGIGRDRKCSDGYYNIGLAYRGLNQASMAISAYREAIRLQPEMVEAHLNLANVLVEVGNYQQAISHYRRALELRPGFERAERGLIAAEKAREQARQAVSPFGRLVNEDDLSAAAVTTQAREMSDEQRLDDRHQVRRLTTEITGDTSQLLECLRKDLEPALMALARAVAQGGDSPNLLGRSLPPFQAALRNYLDLRATHKRRIDEIRAHEAYVAKAD